MAKEILHDIRGRDRTDVHGATMTTLEKLKSQVDSALSAANGKRKQRTMGHRGIAQVLTEAMRDGYGYTTGAMSPTRTVTAQQPP